MEKEYISKEYLIKELKELNIVSFYELNEHSKEAYEEFKGLIEFVMKVLEKLLDQDIDIAPIVVQK